MVILVVAKKGSKSIFCVAQHDRCSIPFGTHITVLYKRQVSLFLQQDLPLFKHGFLYRDRAKDRKRWRTPSFAWIENLKSVE